MTIIRKSILAAIVCVAAQSVSADVRLRVPQDAEPPVYTSAAGPAFQNDGSLFFVSDGEWAAIPFWRDPECVPSDFNLLDQVDAPAAFGCTLLVEGFIRLQKGTFNLMSWEAKGVDEVPVWFVRTAELEAAMADDVLTMEELISADSLLVGSADVYQEQNHTFLHSVSHLSLIAQGTLEDGRTFRMNATEVALGLVQVNIHFRL